MSEKLEKDQSRLASRAISSPETMNSLMMNKVSTVMLLGREFFIVEVQVVKKRSLLVDLPPSISLSRCTLILRITFLENKATLRAHLAKVTFKDLMKIYKLVQEEKDQHLSKLGLSFQERSDLLLSLKLQRPKI